MQAALDHLAQRGFTAMAPLIPTRDGLAGVCLGDQCYYLFRWIEGEPCRFSPDNPAAIDQAAIVLARLHQAAEGLEAPGPVPPGKVRWDRWIAKGRAKTEDLTLFADELTRRRIRNSFEELFLASCPFFLELANLSVDLLERGPYRQVAARERSSLAFCHGDYNYSNLVCDPEGRQWLVDFDNCAYDLRVSDLVRLIRRNSRWNLRQADRLIDVYGATRQISSAELEVLRAALIFPHEFWWVANLHFDRGRTVKYVLERNIQKQGEIRRFVRGIHRLGGSA
jgi:CotS family spore coat protein